MNSTVVENTRTKYQFLKPGGAMVKYTLILFLLSHSAAYAEFETLSLKNYKEIDKVFKQETKDYSPEELLFVFDLDRTMIHSTDCLDKDDKVKFRFEKTVRHCPATITSSLLVDILEKLQKNNYPVMALTARRSLVLKETLGQLEDLLFLSEKELTPLKITFPTAPNYSNRKKTIHFKQQGRKKVLDKTLVIKRGVSMASGANKGLALQAFTKSLEKKNSFKRFVFIDDDQKNINHLEKAYADSKDSILIIHYTEFEKKKEDKKKRKNSLTDQTL